MGKGLQFEIVIVKFEFEKGILNEVCLEDVRINGNEKEDKEQDCNGVVEFFGLCGKRSVSMGFLIF